MPVIDALRRKHGFTETEEDIADYILAHADEVAGMKIGELSAAAFTSNASIVRLCRKLGVDGYRDFRIELASDLERVRVDATNINPDTPFLEGQGTRDIISSVASLSKQAIDQTYASLSPSELRKAAKLVMGAHRVVIYGVGDSEISCEMFANLMLKIGVTCFMANQHGDALAVSTVLGPGDVALLVSYSGSTIRHFSKELKLVFEHDIKAVAISSDVTLPDQFAGVECVLACPTGETNEGKIATYYAQSCIRFVLNCLYGECFAQNYQKNVEMQQYYASQREH
jgi:DNA-binding MurR/RpiR family transcriptional regulator